MNILEKLGRLATWPAWVVALIPGLIGVWLARTWYFGQLPAGFPVLYALVVLVCGVVAWLGPFPLLPSHPRAAVVIVNLGVISIVLLSAVGTALAVWIAVEWTPASPATTPPTEPSTETKEVFTATAAVLTAAVTGGLIKLAESVDATLGDRAKAAFQAKFKNVFPSTSAARLAIFDDGWHNLGDWSLDARMKRAEAVANHPPTTPPAAGTTGSPPAAQEP